MKMKLQRSYHAIFETHVISFRTRMDFRVFITFAIMAVFQLQAENFRKIEMSQKQYLYEDETETHAKDLNSGDKM